MELPKIKTSVFVCKGWSCSRCSYQGDVEVHTLGLGVVGNVYKDGDPIGEGIVGDFEHFDAFLCPECVQKMDFTLYGVTLYISNGRYSGAVFC